jgi:hypothetical protein
MKSKEIFQIILVWIILIFVINFNSITTNNFSLEPFLIKSLGILLIIFASIFGKKLVAYHFETSIEHKIWQWQRFGFKRHHKFPSPLPFGIILPFLLSFLSLGYFLWLIVLEFDIKVLPSRASKRHEMYKFSDLTDTHMSFIAGAGVIACLLLSIIAYLANFPSITKLSIYYAFYSLIPLGNSDGSKVFFGNRIFYFTLAIITLIFLAYALFLP